MSARRPVALLAVAMLWLLAACGVPADRAPRSIPAEEVPFGLLGTTTTSTTRLAPTTRAVVFLIQDDRLVPVRREVMVPATPDTVLATVVTGPTPPEAAAGLRTALVTGVRLLQLSAGTATVRLDRDFVATDIREQILALAQLVYTITELPGVDGVQFTFDGAPAEIPTARGRLKAGPVTRVDFAVIGPAG